MSEKDWNDALRHAELAIGRVIKNDADAIRAIDALRAMQKPEQKEPAKPSRRTLSEGGHYDSQGYCDNPGRGY